MSKFTFPVYAVSPSGSVYSVSHNWRGYGKRELIQDRNASGYPSVRLTLRSRRVRLPVHKLVASLYCNGHYSGLQVRHLDGNKENNAAENLAWGTAKDNADDRARHGRTSRGKTHSAALRNSTQAVRIREYWANRRTA